MISYNQINLQILLLQIQKKSNDNVQRADLTIGQAVMPLWVLDESLIDNILICP